MRTSQPTKSGRCFHKVLSTGSWSKLEKRRVRVFINLCFSVPRALSAFTGIHTCVCLILCHKKRISFTCYSHSSFSRRHPFVDLNVVESTTIAHIFPEVGLRWPMALFLWLHQVLYLEWAAILISVLVWHQTISGINKDRT